MEHPQTTAMPFLPFVDKMLDLFKFHRIHTWMRAFKHPMPKPSCIWSTFKRKLAQHFICKVWSKAREKAARKNVLRSMKRNKQKTRLLSDSQLCRTARRFWKAWTNNKLYWRTAPHSNWVSGGKDLRSSGSYTPSFCNALLDCYASNVRLVDQEGPAAVGNSMGLKLAISLRSLGFSLRSAEPLQPQSPGHRPRWAAGKLISNGLPRSRARRMLVVLRSTR